jgi:hypothetical protein
VYVGAYNRLELDAFVAHLRRIEWNAPEFVQLFVKDQEDMAFRVINIGEAQEPWRPNSCCSGRFAPLRFPLGRRTRAFYNVIARIR